MIKRTTGPFRNPHDELMRLAGNKKIKAIAFGESHWWSNPHRKLLADLIPELSQSGFTHLALELEERFQEALDSFVSNSISDTELAEILRDAGSSMTNKEGVICPHYMELLDQAYRQGLSFLAIDKHRDEKSWFDASYSRSSREPHMAGMLKLTMLEPAARVLILCGANHLLRRRSEHRNKHASLAELLEPLLQESTFVTDKDREHTAETSYCLFTVASVYKQDEVLTGLSFRNLPIASSDLDCATWFDTNANDIASTFLGTDRRCPWGGCDEQCPGRVADICTSIPESPIYADSWNALILYPNSY